MAAAELYAGRSSMFSKWARTEPKMLPLLTDIDAVRHRDGRWSLVEHRTNGYDAVEASGSSGAVERLAKAIGFGYETVTNLDATIVDTSRLLWCFYNPTKILGVCATTDNTWPEDARRPTWGGPSLPPIAVWAALAARCIEAGIAARIIACEPDGSPRVGASMDWVKGLKRR